LQAPGTLPQLRGAAMAIDHVTLMTVSDEGVDIGNLPKAETPMNGTKLSLFSINLRAYLNAVL
jgi:hypothetical protein